ncbi:hypothetical protein LOZ12_003936 [Ophidiomyces ophidiicola]|uniref:Uncharacterized protein n=1 Tax=Ophidiomyces ophidiicola TaxID=1387563 RepID=A0ACB8V253_9EURO|nr:hypothetical protein LOZ62_001055 [Ophidiomyces ophidiicola]KAI1971912.1 hypothetical protein LOZ56_002759 [Ophidiomyces ophidiicola]KAI2009712.1 hypothetical protein LOZ50_001446 [Ophidiomyces ophidiicola]KAI2027292.1 hypothetical protein LOZ48_004815 [Ophidiomyces ophidiicola]KAI2035627.1 hypothetical protein LOZ47_004553 [Ophidiomyces ophidiicola]
MSGKVFHPGSTALITGGGSGIGFAVAQLCRTHGMNLILVDIHAENLAKAHAVLGDTPAAKTITHVMDVSELSSWEYLRDNIANQFSSGVDLLMLNAGASFQAKNPSYPWGDLLYFQKTFATNLKGVLYGINTFLPSITSASHAPKAIVLTGSKQGITNPPGGDNPAYNASKAALKSIAEHLAHDLHSNKNAHVHLLVPGWTFTGITGTSGPIEDNAAALASKPKGAWLPSQVAQYMYEKMTHGKFYIICPDNEVKEHLDKARMSWGVGDITEERPPLSRWNEEWKEKANEWINQEVERRKVNNLP